MVHKRSKFSAPPPGLAVTHADLDEVKGMIANLDSRCISLERTGMQIQAEETTLICDAGFVELARRVERMELLLFRASSEVFEKLDKFVCGVLWSSESDTDVACPESNIPETCQLFSLVEDECQDDSKHDGAQMPSNAISDTLIAKVEMLELEVTKCVHEYEELLVKVGGAEKIIKRSMLPSIFATDLMPSLVEALQPKFCSYEERFDLLNICMANYDKNMDRCLTNIDRLSNSSLSGLGLALKPKSTKGRR